MYDIFELNVLKSLRHNVDGMFWVIQRLLRLLLGLHLIVVSLFVELQKVIQIAEICDYWAL